MELHLEISDCMQDDQERGPNEGPYLLQIRQSRMMGLTDRAEQDVGLAQ